MFIAAARHQSNEKTKMEQLLPWHPCLSELPRREFKPWARTGNWPQCIYWSKFGHSLLVFCTWISDFPRKNIWDFKIKTIVTFKLVHKDLGEITWELCIQSLRDVHMNYWSLETSPPRPGKGLQTGAQTNSPAWIKMESSIRDVRPLNWGTYICLWLWTTNIPPHVTQRWITMRGLIYKLYCILSMSLWGWPRVGVGVDWDSTPVRLIRESASKSFVESNMKPTVKCETYRCMYMCVCGMNIYVCVCLCVCLHTHMYI